MARRELFKNKKFNLMKASKNFFIQKGLKNFSLKSFYQKKKYITINSPCSINVLILSYKNNINNVLITGDIIWFSDNSVQKIKSFISKSLSLSQESIVLSASHTHGTPNPEKSILLPEYSKSFDNYIIKETLIAYKLAKKSKKIKVLMEFSRVINDKFAVNRRRKALSFKNGMGFKMQNLPNFIKKNDKNIDILDILNAKNNKIVATILKVNCHPVSAIKNEVGGDYVGILKEKLKSRSDQVFFLQGFCGDIRPKIIKKNTTFKDYLITLLVGKRFRKQKAEDSLKVASSIFSSIKNKMSMNKKVYINSLGQSKEIFCNLKLENGTFFRKKLNITIWNWHKVIFIFLNGEILSGYNILSYKDSEVICVGYANGMIGYLPTKKDLMEGGYEVDKSRKNFQIESRISIENEKIIKDNILILLKESF